MEHVINLRIQFKKAVEDFKESMSSAGEQMQDFTKAAQENVEASTKIQETWKTALQEFDLTHPVQSLQRLAKALYNTVPALAVLTPLVLGLRSAWQSSVGLQSQMVETLNQVSEASTYAADSMERLTIGERVTRSLRDIHDAALASLSGLEETANVYSSLAMQRVEPNDLKALTTVALQASKALGTSSDQMADLVGHLSRVGEFSEENVRTMAEEFAHVQDMVGLTNEELSNVIELTKQITTQLSAFGASAETITEISSAASRTTAVFKELGFGAQRGAEIINQLFDPSRLQENAFMINRMGIGMKNYIDVMHGGRIEQEQLTEGLVRAAQDLEKMRQQGAHFMALEARAQRMGFNNAREALQLAQRGPEILERMNSKTFDQQQKLQEQAAEGMSQLNRIWKTTKNIFLSVFGDIFSGLMGNVTNSMKSLNEYLMSSMPRIKDALSDFFKTIVEYLAGVDWKSLIDKIINFFSNLGSWIGDAVKWVGELGGKLENVVKWGKRIGIALGGFVILKTLLPIFSAASGAIGGLLGKLKGISSVGSSAAQSLTSLKSAAVGGLTFFLQMAGVAAVIASLGWALNKVADAGLKFNKVDWSSMAKAGVAMAGLTAATVGLATAATALANPVTIAGLAALAGVMLSMGKATEMVGTGVQKMGEGFASFSEHMSSMTEGFKKLVGMSSAINDAFTKITPVLRKTALALQEPLESVVPNLDKMAGAIMEVVTAANKIDPQKLGQLGQAVQSEDVAGFKRLGEAMSGMVSKFNVLRTGDLKEKAEAVSILSESLKKLSVAVWVLGETKNVESAISGVGDLIKTMMESFKGGFTVVLGNVKGIGTAFAEMSKGIERISKLDMSNLGDKLVNISAGIKSIVSAMTAHMGVDIGMGGRGGKGYFQQLGEGFKQMAIGIWALGETDLKKVAANIAELNEPVNSILMTLGGSKGYVEGIQATSEGFGKVTESIADFADIKANKLRSISRMLRDSKSTITSWITAIGEAGANRYKDLKNVGEAFEIVAQSLAKLAGIAGLGGLGERLENMKSAISSVLGALSESTTKTGGLFSLFTGDFNLKNTADSLFTLSEALVQFSNLGRISSIMSAVSQGIDEITGSLQRYDAMIQKTQGDVASRFASFIRNINQAGPIQIQTEEIEPRRGTMTETTTGRGATSTNTIATTIQTAFRAEVNRIVDSINRMNTAAQERHDERILVLDAVRKNTKNRVR